MTDNSLRELFLEELRRDPAARNSDATPSDAQWRAIEGVIRRRTLDGSVRRHTGSGTDIRLEDHASLVTDLATVLATQYPVAGKLIWILACDVMKMERAKGPAECADEELKRLQAQVTFRHRQLLASWQQLASQPDE